MASESQTLDPDNKGYVEAEKVRDCSYLLLCIPQSAQNHSTAHFIPFYHTHTLDSLRVCCEWDTSARIRCAFTCTRRLALCTYHNATTGQIRTLLTTHGERFTQVGLQHVAFSVYDCSLQSALCTEKLPPSPW